MKNYEITDEEEIPYKELPDNIKNLKVVKILIDINMTHTKRINKLRHCRNNVP